MAAAAALCFVTLLAFCFIAPVALMLGYYYGSPELVVVGSGCSRLVETNSFFVEDIEARMEGGSPENGLVFYGLTAAPPLAVPAAWSEARCAIVPANSHREWAYFLNRGSEIEVAYSVRSETESPHPICMIIARGKKNFMQWTDKPSANNTTLLWHLVRGNGTIKQTINLSSEYYIALENLNNQDITVVLEFRIKTLFYNTTAADYACSPSNSLCTYKLPFLGRNVVVLSSGPKEGLNSDDQYLNLSYGPRWIVYLIGLAMLAVALLILYEIVSILFAPRHGDSGGGAGSTRAPLLSPASKEEDSESLGSSYDSASHDGDGEDDDDVEEGGGRGGGGEGRHLCVVCCDARRDCFFLPCGHSATCHSCGTRVAEEDGSCPLCRRKLRKVRRIFTV
ncbi:E3 ubiquitin-protein ligase APD2-like [Oryza brachyantha]|uniref:E3 ubiquitin-protein ligase APD2-like n=1 Tax=Oryza brachyantha TaxID=4533 RepID=UPI001ADBE148|nr:E3 ubiquitin-protein ligase APD2-like [Oryza brachyantha]